MIIFDVIKTDSTYRITINNVKILVGVTQDRVKDFVDFFGIDKAKEHLLYQYTEFIFKNFMIKVSKEDAKIVATVFIERIFSDYI